MTFGPTQVEPEVSSPTSAPVGCPVDAARAGLGQGWTRIADGGVTGALPVAVAKAATAPKAAVDVGL